MDIQINSLARNMAPEIILVSISVSFSQKQEVCIRNRNTKAVTDTAKGRKAHGKDDIEGN
jgi:hypothetical protein